MPIGYINDIHCLPSGPFCKQKRASSPNLFLRPSVNSLNTSFTINPACMGGRKIEGISFREMGESEVGRKDTTTERDRRPYRHTINRRSGWSSTWNPCGKSQLRVMKEVKKKRSMIGCYMRTCWANIPIIISSAMATRGAFFLIDEPYIPARVDLPVILLRQTHPTSHNCHLELQFFYFLNFKKKKTPSMTVNGRLGLTI
jgi:hypothetical protein